MVLVWLAAVAAAIAIAVGAPRADAFGWFAVAAAGCTVLALVLQLIVGRTDGYIARATASVAGALVVFVVATGVLAVL